MAALPPLLSSPLLLPAADGSKKKKTQKNRKIPNVWKALKFWGFCKDGDNSGGVKVGKELLVFPWSVGAPLKFPEEVLGTARKGLQAGDDFMV